MSDVNVIASASALPVDINTLPDYQFVGLSGLFPHIVENVITAEQNSVDRLNREGAAAFQNECDKWISTATLVRQADHTATLPAKPISPASWLVITQDGEQGGVKGKLLARTQTGPVYGVCPNLPALGPDAPLVTGLVKAGTAPQPSQDQKLDSLAVTVNTIEDNVLAIMAALKKAGVM